MDFHYFYQKPSWSYDEFVEDIYYGILIERNEKHHVYEQIIFYNRSPDILKELEGLLEKKCVNSLVLSVVSEKLDESYLKHKDYLCVDVGWFVDNGWIKSAEKIKLTKLTSSYLQPA